MTTMVVYLWRGFPWAFGVMHGWASKLTLGLWPVALGMWLLPGHPVFDALRGLREAAVDMDEFDRRSRPDRGRRDPVAWRIALVLLCAGIVAYGVYARWLS